MKKTFCILLTLLMMLAAAPMARAAIVGYGSCGDNVFWTLDDAGTLTISSAGAMKNYFCSDFFPILTPPRRGADRNPTHSA